MRKSSVLMIVCTCGLLLCGCSAQNASDNMNDTQAEVNQTEDISLEVSQAEGASGSEETPGTQTSGITEQDALAAALRHAGIDESKLTSKRIKKDYEDGKEVYDVEFYADGKEYDYEISVADGSIVKSDSDNKDDSDDGGNQGNEGEISKEEAKKIALAKVPGAEKIQIKRDIENGKPVYEGEIHYNNVEYDFEIDAVTGKILDWEEDAD